MATHALESLSGPELAAQERKAPIAIHELSITDRISYGQACRLLTAAIKPVRKKIAEWFKPLKQEAWKEHRSLCSREREFDEPYATAEAEIEQKIMAFAVAAPTLVQGTTNGVAISDDWSGEVTDKLALVQFVAANPSFLDLVDGNQKKINEVADDQREACEIPGISVCKTPTVSVRIPRSNAFELADIGTDTQRQKAEGNNWPS